VLKIKEFYCRCFNQFGEVGDQDLADNDFERVALFELSLIIHSNNKRLKIEEVTFENMINSLLLSEQEKNILYGGRRFITDIKRPKKRKKDGAKVWKISIIYLT
jgi:hypothetical protein